VAQGAAFVIVRLPAMSLIGARFMVTLAGGFLLISENSPCKIPLASVSKMEAMSLLQLNGAWEI